MGPKTSQNQEERISFIKDNIIFIHFPLVSWHLRSPIPFEATKASAANGQGIPVPPLKSLKVKIVQNEMFQKQVALDFFGAEMFFGKFTKNSEGRIGTSREFKQDASWLTGFFTAFVRR